MKIKKHAQKHAFCLVTAEGFEPSTLRAEI